MARRRWIALAVLSLALTAPAIASAQQAPPNPQTSCVGRAGADGALAAVA